MVNLMLTAVAIQRRYKPNVACQTMEYLVLASELMALADTGQLQAAWPRGPNALWLEQAETGISMATDVDNIIK
jgi:hypothetical protein